MDKLKLMTAMKGDAIPEGWSGLWFIRKRSIPNWLSSERHGHPVEVPPGDYTFLHRLTDATVYAEPAGECVMEDTPLELATHLGFVMRARGKVLITGLGLGCVVRGLLANPNVEHVTCIENSKDVLKLVAPHMPSGRLEIIEAEAIQWTAQNKTRFDAAWHDILADRDKGQPHLDLLHGELLVNCRETVERQGAWSFDKAMKRVLLRRGFQWVG